MTAIEKGTNGAAGQAAWNRPRRYAAAFLTVYFCAAATSSAQSRWDASEPEQTVTFRAGEQAGLGLRLPVEFNLIGHDRWTLTVQLPEPGDLQIQLDSRHTLAQLGESTEKGNTITTPVTLKAARVLGIDAARAAARLELDRQLAAQRQAAAQAAGGLSVEKMAEFVKSQGEKIPKKKDKKGKETIDQGELRKVFIRAKTYQIGADVIRRGIDEVTARRTAWAGEARDVGQRNGVKLAELYARLRAFELAADFLAAAGIRVPADPFGAEDRFLDKVAAVHYAVDGTISKNPDHAEVFNRALTADEKSNLAKALTFRALCHYIPGADPRDPNSTAAAAQHVSCRIPRVARVRVLGRLDPQNHDRADWWLLKNYDPQAVRMTVAEQKGFKVEPPYADRQSVRLRVVATGTEAVDYTLEFHSSAGGKREAAVYEVPIAAEAEFPY